VKQGSNWPCKQPYQSKPSCCIVKPGDQHLSFSISQRHFVPIQCMRQHSIPRGSPPPRAGCATAVWHVQQLSARPQRAAAARTRHAVRRTERRGSLSDEMYGDIASDHPDGPQLVRLDADSSEGLGGTSDDAFGELVSRSACPRQCSYLRWASKSFRSICCSLQRSCVAGNL